MPGDLGAPEALAEWLWPDDRLLELIEALARRAGLPVQPPPGADASPAGSVDWGPEDEARRLRGLAAGLGLEVEPVEAPYGDVPDLVRRAAPALASVPGRGVLALLGSGRSTVRLLGPDLREGRVSAEAVAGLLREEVSAGAREDVERLLQRIGVPDRRRPAAGRALLEDRLRSRRAGRLWYLRAPLGGPLGSWIRRSGVPRWLVLFAANYAVSYTLLLVSWWAIGMGALRGRLVVGWLVAWALLLLTLIPFRLVSVWTRARAAIELGALFKRRLLAGALELRPEEIRHQGVGQLLGRVLEAEALQSYLLHGGFLALVGFIETFLAGVVLTQGAGGASHVSLLLGWLVATGLLLWRYLWARRRWTGSRLEMTHALVEGLVGHRTRLAQEPPLRWHDEEDRDLARYLVDSRGMDRSRANLLALVPRGWLAVGVGALFPAFLAGPESLAGLAIGLGGTLAAYRGLGKLVEGSAHLTAARIIWEQSVGLLDAAGRDRPEGLELVASGEPGSGQALLLARDLHFRHPGRARRTLDGCDLRVFPGERILLEGPSGGGKSTLASILSGLRQADGGLLLLQGLDRTAIGDEGWRRRVITVPQFHENHVFTGTFAFNFLMGRGWPPAEEDLEEARELCRELELGDLLDRMPGGLQQMIGETGWQLSHGERNRLFLARALLQGAELVILDETLAALDPTTLGRVVAAVRRRAPTLLVIGHIAEAQHSVS